MPYICRNPIAQSLYYIYIYTKLFGDLGAIDGDIIYHYWYVVKVWCGLTEL